MSESTYYVVETDNGVVRVSDDPHTLVRLVWGRDRAAEAYIGEPDESGEARLYVRSSSQSRYDRGNVVRGDSDGARWADALAMVLWSQRSGIYATPTYRLATLADWIESEKRSLREGFAADFVATVRADDPADDRSDREIVRDHYIATLPDSDDLVIEASDVADELADSVYGEATESDIAARRERADAAAAAEAARVAAHRALMSRIDRAGLRPFIDREFSRLTRRQRATLAEQVASFFPV